MKKLKTIGIWMLCFLLSSCSCLRVFTGILLDRNTLQPIQSAHIEVTNKGYARHFSSDSTGYFKAYIQGGSKCPRIHIHIDAEGYIPIDAVEPRKRDTVLLFMDRLN